MKEVTLGFLGPCGTHSEEVAIWVSRMNTTNDCIYKLIPFKNIFEAMSAVDSGAIDSCVVPVENSLEGSINITLDTLAHIVDLQVTQEIVWAVHNQLMVKYPGKAVKKIISHAQPLAQCRNYIKEHYADAEVMMASSTAKAAAIVAQNGEGYASIGTTRAGELYGLTTVAEDVQDDMSNCTRFYLLAKRGGTLVQGADKTSLICQINGEKAGRLCDVLWEFAKRDVNLNSIESRPAKTGLGEYIFFLSLDSSMACANVKEAIEAVQKRSLWLKNLGSFNVLKIDKKINKKVVNYNGNYNECQRVRRRN